MADKHIVSVMVWSDYACFTRPELKVERMSYPVMTPSAARGVLDAILFKKKTDARTGKLVPAFHWHIRRITVLCPWWLGGERPRQPEFISVRRTESPAGSGTTAASSTAGWVISALSTSNGDTQMPDTLNMSSLRPQKV